MRLHGMVSFLLVLILGPSSRAEDPDPAIVAAQARQDAIKTIALEFKCTEVIARGAFSHQDRADPLPDAANVVPREESTRESTNRLVIDGNNVRSEDNHAFFFRPAGAIQGRKCLIIHDGSVSKSFITQAENFNLYPECYINKAEFLDPTKIMLLWPITMTFRAFDPQINPHPLAGMMPTGASLTIEGVECREYELKTGATTFLRCWLDPAHDFIPRRITNWKAGVLRDQLDIAFERREPGIWVPVSWVCKQFFLSGNPSGTTRVEVTSLRLNEPQSPDQFAMTFPPGTRVHDYVKQKEYIVQANGDMREDLPSPVTVVTRPGLQWYEQYKFLLAGLVGVLFLIVLLVSILSKKKHRAL